MALSVLAVWDGLPAGMGFLPAANAIVLAGLLPVVVHRVRRWRQLRSPGTAVTAVGVCGLWLWVLLSWFWELLPPVIQAMEICGAPGVFTVSVLQIFVVSLRHSIRPQHLGFVAVAGSTVLTVMAVSLVASDAASLDLRSYRFDVTSHPLNTGMTVALLAANLYVTLVLVQVIWLGVQGADNTPIGWGLGLLAAGSAACLIPVVHDGICMQSSAPGDAGFIWFKAVPTAIAVVCIVAGFAAPPLALYMQARRKLIQLNPIRQHLVSLLPGLDVPLAPGIGDTDVVYEWCSQIQDGLTLIAQQRQTPLEGQSPPTQPRCQADAVARWLTGIPEPNLTCQWLITPDGISGQEWTLAIAAAYRGYASAPGFSGRPSTVRRWLTMSATTWRAPSDRP